MRRVIAHVGRRARQLLVGAVLAALAPASPALANPIEATRGAVQVQPSGTSTTVEGAAITAKSLSTALYTGWITVGRFSKIALEASLVDADSTIEAVTMVCQTSRSRTTANGAGADLPTITVGAADGLSRTFRWCHMGTNSTCGGTDGVAPGTSIWTWVIDNIPAPYLNCKYDTTGGSVTASIDVITVYASGIVP